MQNSKVQQQLSETEIQFSIQQFNEDMENENLEIEKEKQHFSNLYEDLIVYSINPQKESQNHKLRNIEINQFRHKSHKAIKKQQKKLRNQQNHRIYSKKNIKETLMNLQQQQFKTLHFTEETQISQGEWQEDHQIQVQQHVVISLCYQIEDQSRLFDYLTCQIQLTKT
ncbi:unnamed protein product [Paramecium pentaurelia]|uniref:Uncharacterized protein n=1 Tax=Paramecium pentaurelia TaxID=43138 RepID=A0A8S1WS96_9CILI|nr:unnamed protein product [Paramecium pentaurelia]